MVEKECDVIGFDYTIFTGRSVLAGDLDMSLVDNRERRRQAEERGRTQGIEVDYDFFYAEENLALDRPMREGLTLLWRALDMELCEQTCYISSRPQSMWYGSATWLHQFGFPFPYQLILRRQYQKTVVFKPEELETISRYARCVYFFDDSADVRQATSGLRGVMTYGSIEEWFTQVAPAGLAFPR
jgi:hypothetical protein